ncbi:TPA: cytochrome b [Pseudomonas aeruginosa]|nr:cytochrome b [Pseudomonas aeruginosa]
MQRPSTACPPACCTGAWRSVSSARSCWPISSSGCSATTTRSACRYSTLHWVLGLLVGLLLVPRIVSRLRGPRLPAVPGTPLEHRLAHYAHLSLYALMLVMPLTGYVGTRLPTDFGLFVVPSFKDTALFAWISQTWNLSWEAFEKPFDAVHRVVGLWLSTSVVLLHALAAGYHQWVRRDGTLERMLGRRQRR